MDRCTLVLEFSFANVSYGTTRVRFQCDPGVAVDRFFHALYSAKKNDLIPLLLGTACSEVTETLAKIVRYWNVIQVSFGSTAPALSDSTEFPLFLRTVAPDSSHNPARIALIKHFGWDTVTALSQTDDMYSLVSVHVYASPLAFRSD